jgi:hypothetical protein
MLTYSVVSPTESGAKDLHELDRHIGRQAGEEA